MTTFALAATIVALTPAADPAVPTRIQAMLRISGEFLPDQAGMKLTAVDESGPCGRLDRADAPGKYRGILEKGDIIRTVDGKRFATLADFQKLLNDGHAARGTVTLKVKDANSDEVMVWIARPVLAQLPDPAALPPPPDARSWVGRVVLPVRPAVRFGHTGDGGKHVYTGTLTDTVTVDGENGDWVHVRVGDAKGWCPKESLVAADKAADYFARRRELGDESGFALAGRAAGLAAGGDYRAAAAGYAAALKADPTESRWAEKQAEALERAGDRPAAAAAYASANRLNPVRAAAQRTASEKLAAEWKRLAEQERLYAGRLEAASRPLPSDATPEQREQARIERAAVLAVRAGLDQTAQKLEAAQARTGLPAPPTPPDEGVSADVPVAVGGKPKSALDALEKLDARVGEIAGVKKLSDGPTAEDVVGLWVDSGGRTYQFDAGGRFSLPKDQDEVRNHRQAASYDGTWKVVGDEIVSTSREGAYSGMHTHYRKYRLDGDELVVVADWQGSYEIGGGRGRHQEYRLRRR
jgi:hypothetical protein